MYRWMMLVSLQQPMTTTPVLTLSEMFWTAQIMEMSSTNLSGQTLSCTFIYFLLSLTPSWRRRNQDWYNIPLIFCSIIWWRNAREVRLRLLWQIYARHLAAHQLTDIELSKYQMPQIPQLPEEDAITWKIKMRKMKAWWRRGEWESALMTDVEAELTYRLSKSYQHPYKIGTLFPPHHTRSESMFSRRLKY